MTNHTLYPSGPLRDLMTCLFLGMEVFVTTKEPYGRLAVGRAARRFCQPRIVTSYQVY